jgi:hypothetical protein
MSLNFSKTSAVRNSLFDLPAMPLGDKPQHPVVEVDVAIIILSIALAWQAGIRYSKL